MFGELQVIITNLSSKDIFEQSLRERFKIFLVKSSKDLYHDVLV